MGKVSGLKLTEIADQIAQAALNAVRPERLVAESVIREGRSLIIGGQQLNLGYFEKINLVSIGKAGKLLAESLIPLIEDKLNLGVITGSESYQQSGILYYYPAAHPLPDRWSVEAGQKAYELALSSGEKDLFLMLISGGGSSHLCLPEKEVSLEEKRNLTEMLLKTGADIKELNTVRKHISRIKGGRLAKAAWPAKIINLVISDVIGNDLESIASGPTWFDSTTFGDAIAVMEKYGLRDICPSGVWKVLQEGYRGLRSETLKKGDRVLDQVSSVIIGDNLKAIYAAKQVARQLDLETIVLTSEDSGEARIVAADYIKKMIDFGRKVQEQRRAFCLLAGGELTVTVKGRGLGGRNTEFVLAGLIEILKHQLEFQGFNWLVVSLATDGRDGPTDSAGAWISPETLERVRMKNLSPEKYLENNDSYHFFKEAEGLLTTGPTGTNVMDLRFFLLVPRES